MAAGISSSMIPGVKIHTKSFTEGFQHDEQNSRFDINSCTDRDAFIDQQKTGTKIFTFVGLIRLKQQYEWSLTPNSAANCTLISSRSTHKSDQANGFSAVPIQALYSKQPKRLTLTAPL